METQRCDCLQGKCVGQWNMPDDIRCARVSDIANGIPPEVVQHGPIVDERDKLRAVNAELVAALQESADYLHTLRLTADHPTASHCGQVERQARAAIAKATQS